MVVHALYRVVFEGAESFLVGHQVHQQRRHGGLLAARRGEVGDARDGAVGVLLGRDQRARLAVHPLGARVTAHLVPGSAEEGEGLLHNAVGGDVVPVGGGLRNIEAAGKRGRALRVVRGDLRGQRQEEHPRLRAVLHRVRVAVRSQVLVQLVRVLDHALQVRDAQLLDDLVARGGGGGEVAGARRVQAGAEGGEDALMGAGLAVGGVGFEVVGAVADGVVGGAALLLALGAVIEGERFVPGVRGAGGVVQVARLHPLQRGVQLMDHVQRHDIVASALLDGLLPGCSVVGPLGIGSFQSVVEERVEMQSTAVERDVLKPER
mmetsp:Transcript_28171/g.61726  ORF Transcript_28171/g.61726 Transcript_28171/m.61726 type:complete len:320 (+) Transcript_28171:1383-2342(+)